MRVCVSFIQNSYYSSALGCCMSQTYSVFVYSFPLFVAAAAPAVPAARRPKIIKVPS
jgi:hypothetical protein